jgi:flagellar hook-associated protein 3 FlgL
MNMRIASSTIYDVGARAIAKNQSDLLRLQNQFATGKKMNSVADNPVAAIRASELATAKSVNDQYERNQVYARNALANVDGLLGNLGDVMQDLRETLVAAGNSGMNPVDRKYLGEQMRSKLDELLRLANSRDEAGRYLFSGYRDASAPFALTGGILTYEGDNGLRELPVSATTNMALNVSGSELFLDVRSGNGVIQTSNAPGNTGAGLVSGGSIVNASALSDDSYEVRIRDVAGTLVYDVVNTTTASTLVTGSNFTADASITVGPALSISISGIPANGDVFKIEPAQSQNVFQSIDKMIRVIDEFAAGSISSTALADNLRIATSNLDQSFERVLSLRNRYGNMLQELERQSDINSRNNIEIQSRISELTDLDMVQAISDFSRTQAALEASQALYAKVSKRNLFDYL